MTPGERTLRDAFRALQEVNGATVGVVVPATGPAPRVTLPPAPPPAATGIIGKTVETGLTRGVILAVHYDQQDGRWYALVQRDDGSLDGVSLYAAKVVGP